MNANLVKSLENNNAFEYGNTTVSVRNPITKGLEIFTLMGIDHDTQKVTISDKNRNEYQLSFRYIKEINQMPLHRFADSFDLHLNGVISRKVDLNEGVTYLYDTNGNLIKKMGVIGYHKDKIGKGSI